MRFILWTLVWFSLIEMQRILYLGYPYIDRYKSEYGSNTMGIISIIHLFLWIFLYLKFVK